MLGMVSARLLGLLLGVTLVMTAPARSQTADVAPVETTLPTAIALGPQAKPAACRPMPDLPRRLATASKYDQSIASKSVIDLDARQRREEQLAPVSGAILSLTARVRSTGNAKQQAEATDCTIATLRHWAAAGALTDMATSDANLTRDRFTSEIAGIVMTLQARGQDLRQERAIRAWLSTLAHQTMTYYDAKAGPTARRNNHRYLAGLAVAEIADILGDEHMQAWSKDAFAIGACQVDDHGYLPLELARAERAYEYHLYAYGALARLATRLAAGGAESLPCADGLDRLYRLVSRGENSALDFERRTGLPQRPPSRQHLALIQHTPPRPEDMQTTGDVNKL